MERFGVVFLAVVLGFALAQGAPEPLKVEVGGQALEVEGSLVRYRFSQLGGTLESAFIHFSSYRSQAVDAVPGWTGSGEDRALAPGVSLPFEVWQGDARADEGAYRLELDQPDENTASVSLVREGVLKEFTVRTDALYTLEVRLRLSGDGDAVRVVLGHRPSGKGAPDLLFLYDGKSYSSPLPPDSASRLEGLGLVGGEVVYFLRLDEAQGFSPFMGMNDAGQPVFGLEVQALAGEAVLKGVLYTGRNRYVLLEKAGLAGLTELGLFSRFLVLVMRFFEWLYNLTGNYGWAIILFTLITRVVLYPLMRNQLRSMAKMQRLAPKIKKLQERYKDDRETLQKQMMELYRQERVNPLGGCFPMLLQFPILILLWQAILYSAEQIHLSPGFLWIGDLSQPDPYYVLVILTTGVMLLQQWLTQRRMPEQGGGGSQAIGWLFPVIMAVLFMSFPAGLWLYWLLTTVIQMGQQLVVDWEMARERQAPAPSEPDGSKGR
ncbi:MAG: Membrane protein insertase YidC [Acetothermia bacterium 64_32]|nr:MAG: Membrane protein insertase YidC [Acetothermia bacterium 64_32]